VPELPAWSAPSIGGKGRGSSTGSGKGSGRGSGKGSGRGSGKGSGQGSGRGSGKGSRKGSGKGSGSETATNRRDRPTDLEEFDFLKVGAKVCCYLTKNEDWYDGVITDIQTGLDKKETYVKFNIKFDDDDTGEWLMGLLPFSSCTCISGIMHSCKGHKQSEWAPWFCYEEPSTCAYELNARKKFFSNFHDANINTWSAKETKRGWFNMIQSRNYF